MFWRDLKTIDSIAVSNNAICSKTFSHCWLRHWSIQQWWRGLNWITRCCWRHPSMNSSPLKWGTKFHLNLYHLQYHQYHQYHLQYHSKLSEEPGITKGSMCVCWIEWDMPVFPHETPSPKLVVRGYFLLFWTAAYFWWNNFQKKLSRAQIWF